MALGDGLEDLGGFLEAVEDVLEQLGGALEAKMSEDGAKIAPREKSFEHYRADGAPRTPLAGSWGRLGAS